MSVPPRHQRPNRWHRSKISPVCEHMHNDNPDDWRHVSVVPSSGLYRLSCWDKDSLPDEPVEIRFFDRKSEAKAHGALFIEGAL